ncbi:MAG TPA: HepT-like ribonuclease domain-containing protein [Gemmatimonadales bacterium]|nr:HepT-like ribonuclease domain-containing protein [Gemmatimonadales bacterium]
MRGDRLRLQDILDAIEIIEQDTPSQRRDFDANRAIQSHILLHAQIIGEAVSRLSQALRDHARAAAARTLRGTPSLCAPAALRGLGDLNPD